MIARFGALGNHKDRLNWPYLFGRIADIDQRVVFAKLEPARRTLLR